MVVTFRQQYNVGEKPAIILYTYINRHAGTPSLGCGKYFIRVQYSTVQHRVAKRECLVHELQKKVLGGFIDGRMDYRSLAWECDTTTKILEYCAR